MPSPLPDFDVSFVNEADMEAFARAVSAPDAADHDDQFISAHNDWKPVKERIVPKNGKSIRRRRGKDETREGIFYTLTKWPLLAFVSTWIFFLSIFYVLTRFYISQYEYWITWRGEREKLRKKLRAAESYKEWIKTAGELDKFLGADQWKEEDAFAYYDHTTVRRIVKDLRKVREKSEMGDERAVEELRALIEACVKNNFAGIESARMYSQTYYGTKNLVQNFVDEVERCLKFLVDTPLLPMEEKRVLFKHLSSNYGRTALCLSGGACFSYYHFGVIKAHLDANLLPKIITGTSGGALVAALICTRTDAELKQLLVPELANKITACHDDTMTWVKRWYKTGARFDSVDWATRCCWFTRGSMTFKEAYQRTGRILNISCVPSDPHTPSLLLNYLTAPDCCIFSAVLASAAVPGILNPVVLMTKTRRGVIAPYSFGNKWKDGSLRTDIPIRSLNLHFNVNFSIVSQVNPHVNIFFFSSRGSVGRPVTHRRGKGWRGGFLGSAIEQYIKLDLAKWLKVARHLELLPRPMSQDWSSVFLQKFDGTITLWPKTVMSDFWYILTDPTPKRLERMLKTGQVATYPKLKFVENRLKIERMVEKGRKLTRSRSSEVEEEVKVREEQEMQKRRASRSSLSARAGQQMNGDAGTRRASASGIAGWFPWRQSVDLGNGGVRQRVNGEVKSEEELETEESVAESTVEEDMSSEASEVEMDAGGGMEVRPGEAEKFEARGETILGA
ncbi:hypothetical protein FPQ18DRAFT_47242 [Pyronema domesticum]|uniref:Patatin-like phospholipase domain-containing protein n=1 Tax=Pyronema omphalodes (strain CBS 100304) TaxID=1076935 RepID=U4KXL7_PYROM|nr:hypothetical protein FPQ18DRAFT_47242 [Pyronema domesticum]CCX06556.1 Similar to Patatin-like phospholipase domain-containing protein ATEG_02594; acc. no. Q0CUP0 [Pyronema omphalodes CBS 100304]